MYVRTYKYGGAGAVQRTYARTSTVALARYNVRTVIAKRTYAYGTFTVRRTYPYMYYEYGNVLLTGTVVVFTGTLTATRYVDILDAALVPFLDTVYPDIHRFQQDNDPKHTGRYTKNYIEEKGINWFKTPASSPDLNPIELIWHTLKDYLRNDYKPKNLSELTSEIKEFWATLTPSICKKYVSHLKKVIPKVIEVRGLPSGY